MPLCVWMFEVVHKEELPVKTCKFGEVGPGRVCLFLLVSWWLLVLNVGRRLCLPITDKRSHPR